QRRPGTRHAHDELTQSRIIEYPAPRPVPLHGAALPPGGELARKAFPEGIQAPQSLQATPSLFRLRGKAARVLESGELIAEPCQPPELLEPLLERELQRYE